MNSDGHLASRSLQFFESEELDSISESIQVTIDEDIQLAKGGLGSRNARMVGLGMSRQGWNGHVLMLTTKRLSLHDKSMLFEPSAVLC